MQNNGCWQSELAAPKEEINLVLAHQRFIANHAVLNTAACVRLFATDEEIASQLFGNQQSIRSHKFEALVPIVFHRKNRDPALPGLNSR